MICKNCGAEYADDSLQCPYCHTENRKVALRRKKEILRGYDEEAEEIKAQAELYPEKTAKKWTGYIVRGLGILFAAGVIITIIAIIVSKISVNLKYEEKQTHAEKLESLFAAGNYAGMSEYIDKENLRGYDKYDQVYNMYRKYKDIKQNAQDIRSCNSNIYDDREEWKNLNEYSLRFIMSGGADLAAYYEEYVQDKVFLGNEEALKAIHEKGMEEFKKFGFTQEEIAELALGSESPKWAELSQKLEDYFWEKAD